MKKYFIRSEQHLKYSDLKSILMLSKSRYSQTNYVYNKLVSISHLFNPGLRDGYWVTFSIVFKRKKIFKICIWGHNEKGAIRYTIKPKKRTSFQKILKYIKRYSFSLS